MSPVLPGAVVLAVADGAVRVQEGVRGVGAVEGADGQGGGGFGFNGLSVEGSPGVQAASV